jgi:hypothetical protein
MTVWIDAVRTLPCWEMASMRGRRDLQTTMLAVVDLEERVHRTIRCG